MFIERKISSELVALFGEYPVLTLTGPRQSGKSTLCRRLFASLPYVSMEDLDVRQYASDDPRGFLAQYSTGAVLDEIQRVPSLLSYIQTEVDRQGRNGQYVLTGSQQFVLHEGISQSLAGRTAIARLLPLSGEELAAAGLDEDLSCREIIFRGSYPRVVAERQNPTRAYAFYTSTYLEKDIRQVIQVQDLKRFEIFLKLCAGRTGQLVNYSAIAGETGIDVKTAQRWLSVLEAAYIVRMIRPYYRNLNKRLVKSPKLYFVDTGLACYLLGIRTAEQLRGHPLYGALFETYVVGECLKAACNRVEEDDLYFFRDNRGREVDLIRDHVTEIDAVEIKSAETVHASFFKGIDYLRNLPVSLRSCTLVYGGKERQTRLGTKVVGWRQCREALFATEKKHD